MKRFLRRLRVIPFTLFALTGACGETASDPKPNTGGSSGNAGAGAAGAGGSSGTTSGGGGALCADYTGGAFVDFAIVDDTLRVWVEDAAFIAEAARLLAADETRVPVFNTLLDGTDCDSQWSWHPDPIDLEFADFTIELCDGTPSYIEENKAEWMTSVGSYCPWSARVTAVNTR